MITVPAGTRILLAARPVDFRKGAHGLSALAQEVLAEDPFSGAVIVFRSKRSGRVTFYLPSVRYLADASRRLFDIARKLSGGGS
jgi:transposase